MDYIRLNNNILMPYMGHGVAIYKGEKNQQRIENGLELALQYGHRMIDTGQFYKQDELIGRVLKKSRIKRKELFITSKLWPTIIGKEKESDNWVKKSLHDLKTDYFDQLLLHFSVNKKINILGWKILEKYLEKGITRSIGVSNYDIFELRQLVPHCQVIPQVNQIEGSLVYLNFHLLYECNIHNIQVVAYSPLARYRIQKRELWSDDSRMKLEVAAKSLKMTSAQIMLAYLMGRGIIPIVQANTKSHIIENLRVLDFQQDFILAVNLLSKLQGRKRISNSSEAFVWDSK